jgi:GTP-binding protein EngB required for normal cell division
MFLSAMIYSEKADKVKDKEQIKQIKRFEQFLDFVLPYRFCREFIVGTLEKDYPLDFSGRKVYC